MFLPLHFSLQIPLHVYSFIRQKCTESPSVLGSVTEVEGMTLVWLLHEGGFGLAPIGPCQPYGLAGSCT